ncbi:MAG: hypothetical protein ACTSUE_25495 [Promethearchaeota archaeon]
MPRDEEEVYFGHARCGFKPPELNVETGCLEPRGLVYFPRGRWFLHITRNNETREYKYMGATFQDESQIPPVFADLEFTEFYREGFEPYFPETVIAKIEKQVYSNMAINASFEKKMDGHEWRS